MLFRVARTITKERTWWFPRHFFRMFPNIHINSTTIRTSSSSKEKQIFNMALRMALCVLFLAASMATLSVADDQSCAEKCRARFPGQSFVDVENRKHCVGFCTKPGEPMSRGSALGRCLQRVLQILQQEIPENRHDGLSRRSGPLLDDVQPC